MSGWLLIPHRSVRYVGRIVSIGVLVGAMGVGGCLRVGPDYHRPEMKGQPQKWQRAADVTEVRTRAFTDGRDVDTVWWQQWHDPLLNRLITRLGYENLDIGQAAMRVLQARDQLRVVASEGLPSLNWAGSYTWTQQSTHGFLTLAQPAPGANLQYQQYANIGTASWDLDIFGRIRRLVEAGKARVVEQEAFQHGVELSSIADFVEAYLRLRSVQEQLRLTERRQRLAQHDLTLVLERRQEGAANDLAVAQARGQLEQIESTLPPLRDIQAALINALGYMLALPPRALEKELSTFRPQPDVPVSVGVGVPSSLLERRPDIMMADARLHAVTAEVGAAKAAFYPDINLVGNLGTQSLSASDFFMPAAKYFTLGPTLNVPLFEGGRLAGMLALRKAEQKEVAISYRQVVLNAWREVDDAITRQAQVQLRYEHLAAVVRQNQRAFDVAQSQYREGAVPFLEVDQAEGVLLSNQVLLAALHMEATLSAVSLYRALGGGWQSLVKERGKELKERKTVLHRKKAGDMPKP